MNPSLNWQDIVKDLDYLALPIPTGSMRRWVRYERCPTGLRFVCETAGGETAHFQADVIAPDVIRFRMGLRDLEPRTSEMLVPRLEQSVPFELTESADAVILATARLRVEFRRFPWQIRAFDAETGSAAPFFSQQIEDRAYGPAYETPPVGFEHSADGQVGVFEAITAAPDEALYGFGERFSRLNRWGQSFVSWAVDSGNVTSRRAYKSIPFWMNNAGYGIFIHTAAPIVYHLGSISNSTYAFHILEEELDYFLIYGPAFKHILSRYTELTGRAPIPPKWSFGFWISRCGYKSRAEVESIAREMRARDFPCDVLSLDPWWMGPEPWSTYEWDTTAFPDPAGMLAELKAQGIRTCLWITPYVAPGCRAYTEGLAGGYFLKRANGSLAPAVEAFAGVDMGVVDFTHPEARVWFQSKLETLLDMGAAVFKTDFGEQAPADAVYHDGRQGVAMHNLYPLLYNGAVFELTRRKFGRGLTWGRSAYAGSQRYPVQWGGDSYASFAQMTGQLRALLGYGLSGVPFCSHDVGGFDYQPSAFDAAVPEGVSIAGENIKTWWQTHGAALEQAGQQRDAEVYIRWLQFGVFSSHTRAHGKQPREPWAYGAEAEAIARRYLKLRYRLLPYIYTETVKSTQTGLPMVRPLVLDYQDDPNTANLDLQYLFGEAFLVAPILTREHRRKVYLPAGEWVDFWTKERLAGGRWIEVSAPLDTLPLWVKAGSVIPLGPEMDFVNQKPLSPLMLEFYAPEAAGALTIHDEDRPDITVHYIRQDDTFHITVQNAPGAVEVSVFGSDTPLHVDIGF